MPEDIRETENLIDVGETVGAEINLDDKGEPEKFEAPKEDIIEVEEQVASKEESQPEEKAEEKDELKEYSEGVQKRIAKLTRKMREAERQREEAIAFAEAQKRQKDELEGRFSKLDKSYVSEFESRVKNSLTAAKQALKSAIESQDIDGQIAAQQQIATLTMDEARLNNLKSSQVEQPTQEKEVNITPQQNVQSNRQPQADPKAEAWASRNTWFGSDSAMTYTAFDLHKKLTEEEGFDAQSDEYYAEIDKRIRLEFPHKFDKVESNTAERAKPAQTVASAKRPSATGRRKTVKLTPSQVAIAKRLGVPLEEYAKQLTAKEA